MTNHYIMRLLGSSWYLALDNGTIIRELTVDSLTPKLTAIQYLTEAGVVNPQVTIQTH